MYVNDVISNEGVGSGELSHAVVEIVIAVVLLHGSDLFVDGVLARTFVFVVVEAGADVVEVVHFAIDFVHSAAGELH